MTAKTLSVTLTEEQVKKMESLFLRYHDLKGMSREELIQLIEKSMQPFVNNILSFLEAIADEESGTVL